MARSIKQIQQGMIDSINQEPSLSALDVLTDNEQQSLSNLTSQSRVSAWRKMIYVVAQAIYFFEVLMDSFRLSVQQELDSQRVHKLSWYQNVLLNYQHGASYDDNGQYDNSVLTESQIEAMKVFKYAAVTRTVQGGVIVLRGKVANEVNGSLQESDATHITAGQSYMNDNTDAGTNFILTSGPGDDLKLELEVFFDPAILDSDGKRLDGTNDTPVIEATNEFLKQIEFNGSYVKAYHVDALQKVEGVKVPVIRDAASKYGSNTYTTTTVANAGAIDQIRVADSGWFKLDLNELQITYTPYAG